MDDLLRRQLESARAEIEAVPHSGSLNSLATLQDVMKRTWMIVRQCRPLGIVDMLRFSRLVRLIHSPSFRFRPRPTLAVLGGFSLEILDIVGDLKAEALELIDETLFSLDLQAYSTRGPGSSVHSNPPSRSSRDSTAPAAEAKKPLKARQRDSSSASGGSTGTVASAQQKTGLFRVYTRKGTRSIDWRAYRGLAARVSDFDLFLDGREEKAWRPFRRDRREPCRVTLLRIQMLAEFVEARCPLQPGKTQTAKQMRQSHETADSYFRSARRMVDRKGKDGQYSFFKTVVHGLDAPNVYEFAPAKSLSYCIVVFAPMR
jgi:hypothetical protein